MPTLDPFAADAFSMVSLTNAINILPNNYGRVRELGIFRDKPVTTRNIMVEEMNGVLNLLPTMPPGSPGTVGKSGKRTVRSFVIPHIPHDDAILPEAYQGIRAFGSESQQAAVAQIVTDRMQTMKNKHAITLEHFRIRGLQGVVIDADGSTIYDYFTEFGITKKTVDFLLGTSTTKVSSKCREVVRWIEAHLQGEVMTRVHALVDETFFDKLITHALVKEAYAGYAKAADMLGGDVRKGFTFGGITFEEYTGTVDDAAGTARKFITTDYGIAFPMGTNDTFQTVYCPADFNETANQLGKPLYAKIAPRKFDRGYDLHTQSNPLPICNRPAVLVEIKTSN